MRCETEIPACKLSSTADYPDADPDCLAHNAYFQSDRRAWPVVRHDEFASNNHKQDEDLLVVIEIYFTSFNSLIRFVAPPSLSIHQSTNLTSTQIVRFRSLSNAILWLSAS